MPGCVRRWDQGEFSASWAQVLLFEAVRRADARTVDRGVVDALRRRACLGRDWAAADLAGVAWHPTGRAPRSIGANAVPSHVEVDSYDALWRLLGVQASVRRFAELRTATESELTDLVGFMNRRPMTVLAYAGEWRKLVRTVRWVASTQSRRNTYLRQVPVAGIDTKLIERRRGILSELIDEVLPAEQIDRAYPASQFERRYGFASKPTLVRLRSLDPRRPLLPRISELTVRAVEFSAIAPDVAIVYIIENEVTYLAFPNAPDAVVLWGSGFAISGFASLPWFCDRRVVYWGDIDTHGFVALDRLRAVVPHTKSLLMDRETLLAHPEQWTQEPSPTTVPLPHLTDPERDLYRELVDGIHGDRIRLEQERVSYPFIETATDAPCDDLGR